MKVCTQTHFTILTGPTREVAVYAGETFNDADAVVVKNPGYFETVTAVAAK